MLLVRVNSGKIREILHLREGNNYLKILWGYINRVRSVIIIFVYKFGDIYGIVTFRFVFHSEWFVGPFHAFALSFLVTYCIMLLLHNI
jgi:hypothetical protein